MAKEDLFIMPKANKKILPKKGDLPQRAQSGIAATKNLLDAD